MKDGKPIAWVTCRPAPDNVRTLADWLAWREREHERMKRELDEQLLAAAELHAGATRH